MMQLTHILTYLLGIYTGSYFLMLYLKYKIKKENKKVNIVYSNLTKNILEKNPKFIFRINNYLRVDTYIENIGNVNIYFFTNKNDINIFQNEEVIYTSNNVDKKIIDNLNFILKTKFSLEINDTLNVFGIIYSRKYFIDNFNVDKSFFKNADSSELNKNTNEDTFDIDSILDKINLVGFEKLTNKEKEFLNNYSNRNQ
jgi:hypothetical protein